MKCRENVEPNRMRDPQTKRLSPHSSSRRHHTKKAVFNENECEAKIRFEFWSQCNERMHEMEEELKQFKPGFDIHVEEPAPEVAPVDLQKRLEDLKRKYEQAMKRNEGS